MSANVNANNIRKVMGKENAGAISPTPPLLGSTDSTEVEPQMARP
jgi:hypothetical protein